MKRANKLYCVLLAAVAASAIAVPLVFQHDGQRASDEALQLDVGSHSAPAGGSDSTGASHIGSDGPPLVGTSFPEIEHFSFRPVMGEIDDSHTPGDGAVLNVNNEPFPVAYAGNSGNSSAASGNAGIPGTPGGFSAGSPFHASAGYGPLQLPPQGSSQNAAYLPFAVTGTAPGSSDTGNSGSTSNAPGNQSGSGGTGDAPGSTEGVFNPAFNALPSGGLPDGTPMDAGSVADVPEPATVALLGLGMLGFAVSRRKAARR